MLCLQIPCVNFSLLWMSLYRALVGIKSQGKYDYILAKEKEELRARWVSRAKANNRVRQILTTLTLLVVLL